MSLDKSIEHGKEHRKPYRKAKSVDRTCRNHGTCPWCEGNRKHNAKMKEEAAKQQEEEVIDGPEQES